jgi:hypothetical protein
MTLRHRGKRPRRGPAPLWPGRKPATSSGRPILTLPRMAPTRMIYALGQAVTDWLAVGLPGRAAKTIEANWDSLKPVLARIGRSRCKT